MNKEIIQKHIENYLAGKDSTIGEKLFEEWYNSLDESDDRPFHHLSEKEKEILKTNMFQNIRTSIDHKTKQAKKPLQQSSRRIYTISIAASVLLLIVAGIIFSQFFQTHPSRLTQQVWETSFGEVKEIILPDGSIVSLNGNSKLWINTPWDNNRPREVKLEGEGFFIVQHKQNHQKFLVHTEDVQVEVVGTAFNVNKRRGTTEVFLQKGKVKLGIPAAKLGASLEMSPGQMVTYNAKTSQLRQSESHNQVYSTWVNKEIILENTPLADLAQRLEDTYGYQIKFSNP